MEEKENKTLQINKPQDLAKYYDYLKRCLDASLNFQVSLANFTGKTTYIKNKEAFDKLYNVCSKYDFDTLKYISFIIKNNIPASRVADPKIVYSYAMNIQSEEKHKKIYSYFMKSVKNIVSECKKHGFRSTVDFLKYIIKNNVVANMYLSGKISEYYLANIALLPKIVSKLDPLSQDTLNYLVDQQEKINSDLQDAFVYIKGMQVDAIKFTDKIIASGM